MKLRRSGLVLLAVSLAASSNYIRLVEPGPLSSEDAEALAVVRESPVDLLCVPHVSSGVNWAKCLIPTRGRDRPAILSLEGGWL